MKLQFALDIYKLEKALAILREVAQHVDIIEAGTPLVKQEGIRVVSIFKECFPDKLILADLKTMDAGALEAQIAYDAQADYFTVLATAGDATIKGAVDMARSRGRKVVADMIGVPDRAARAHALKEIGVDMIELHAGLDEQASKSYSIADLLKIGREVDIPFAVAGGITEKTIRSVQDAGAAVAVVGGGIYSQPSPPDTARHLKELISA